ncbi:MAG: response regulator [Planctomycetota bacterium]
MKKKILVVDDDKAICNMLHYIIQQIGYEVITVYSGTEALEAIETQKPDLILLDLHLPHMSGIETLKKIKKIDRKSKVIIMTAYNDESEKIVKTFSLGAIDCIFKPFNIEILKDRIRETLGLAE